MMSFTDADGVLQRVHVAWGKRMEAHSFDDRRLSQPRCG